MAATTPLLTALLKKATIDDHEEILKASNAALKKNKSDSEAQHVKVISLLNLEQYANAVEFVEESGEGLKNKARFEYAYALYKIGRFEDAATIAQDETGRGARHLEAQARYRMEDAERAAQIYQELEKQPENESFDLRVNRAAIDALHQWIGQSGASSTRRPGREELEAFETAYNAACGSIARGELAQAEVLLKRAKELCKHSEDLSESQKVEELLPILVQQLYVLEALGKTDEAESLAKEMSVDDTSDASSKRIGQSNKLLVSEVGNPFLAHKTFHSDAILSPNDKLFSYQSMPYVSNAKTIDLQALKLDGLASAKPKARNSDDGVSIGASDLISSVFSVAAKARGEVSKAAIRKVLPELEQRPNDVGLILTVVQMYVLTGNTTAATELVESLLKRLESSSNSDESETRYMPGLVAVIVSLYRSQGRRSQIKQELAKAASYWRHKSKPPRSLLLAAGSSLLEAGDSDDTKQAADIFTKLREQNKDDKIARAGYVASHAESDGKAVSREAEQLSSVGDLTRNVDVDALERTGIPPSSNAFAIAQLNKTRKRAAPDGATSKPKRNRKSRLPKDIDPNKKPDPERWLPMKDRSYYRAPKGKRKGKKAGDDRTQGGAVNENLNIDAKPAGGQTGSGGGGGVSGGGGKKKKGKK